MIYLESIFPILRKIFYFPNYGSVDIGGDSRSSSCGFETRNWILIGQIFTSLAVKLYFAA